MLPVLVEHEEALQRELGRQVRDGHGARRVLGGGPGGGPNIFILTLKYFPPPLTWRRAPRSRSV